MSHYYNDIKAGIITVLQATTKVKQIYNFEQIQPAGYPTINVFPTDGDAQFLDTSRVRRQFMFTCQLLQERLEVGPSEAERIMTSLVDQVISIFDDATNTTLNNTVIFCHPVKNKWGYLNVPDADVRSCEITLIAEVAQ
jgi:hypothetical protein